MSEREAWQERARQALDGQNIDASTRDALQAARRRALDGSGRPAMPAWARAAAFATLVIGVVAVIGLGLQREAGFPGAEADDLAVIASEDEFELYEELEFYVWFDQDESV